MKTYRKYLEENYDKVFDNQNIFVEKMEGSPVPVPTDNSNVLTKGAGQSGAVAETLQLEIYENGQKIRGFVNNERVDMDLKEFIQKYPDVAKSILAGDQVVKYAADVEPPADFVKNPRTKGQVIKTPDVEKTPQV